MQTKIDKTVGPLPEEVGDTDKLPTKRIDDLFMYKYYEVKGGMKIEPTLKQMFPSFNNELIEDDSDAKMVGVAGLDIHYLRSMYGDDIELVTLDTTMRQFEIVGKHYHRKIMSDNILGMNEIIKEEIKLFPWGRGRSYVVDRMTQIFERAPIVDYLEVLKEISIECNVRLYIRTTLAEVLRDASEHLDILIYFDPRGEMSVPYNKVGQIDNDILVERLGGEMMKKEMQKPTPLDFNMIVPNDHYIHINYRDSRCNLLCDSEEDTINLSKDVAITIERIEKSSKESVLVDIRMGKDELGGSVEYELRQNLDGSFVILRDTHFGKSKVKLPIHDAPLTPADAVAKWVRIK